MSAPLTRRLLAATAVLATGTGALVGVALSSPAAAATPTATVAPAAVPGAPTAAAPVPAGLVPVRTLTSLLGTHAWYAQTFRGLPVVDSYYAVHTSASGATSIDDGRLAVPASLGTTPRLSAASATGAATSAVAARAGAQSKAAVGRLAKNAEVLPTGGTSTATLSVVGGATPALVWSVVTTGPSGSSRTLVDATTGAVRDVRSLSKNAETSPSATTVGSGKVFAPNPVVKLKDESLKDQNDSDAAVPASAYSTLPLPHLTAGTTLVGLYAQVVRAKGGLATSPTRDYLYTRADDRFEQVNAYYAIDKAQTYIHSLGFTDVNNESQKLNVNTQTVDNSQYDPSTDTITYGTGGVDDAEDVEVVWHEYGHAIQDAQVPGYGASEEAGATGEGFGDYWALTMSQPIGGGYITPCIMDWDSTSYTTTTPHCLRRTDTGKTVADKDGEVHDDGEIWSNALWDINQSVGRVKANTLILEAQFTYTPGTSFSAAATKTVNAATTLYGSATGAAVRRAFVARGILS